MREREPTRNRKRALAAEKRAQDYFLIAQRSEEITPDDVAWGERMARQVIAR
jgi:hypothetical protein